MKQAFASVHQGVRSVLRRIVRTAAGVLIIATLIWLAPVAIAQDVLTSHYDNTRSGVQPNEGSLTPANVNYGGFGKVLNFTVDGDVYSQTLYVSQYTMLDGQKHNVLFVTSQHDWVYAFDADGNNPSTGYLWRVSLLGSGETWVANQDVNSDDISPAIGITGTPVIDRSGGYLYVVAKSKSGGNFYQRLHALNLADGTEKLNGPTLIQATAPGTGQGGSTVSFNALTENQRPALLLAPTPGGASPNSVFIAWASHGDNGTYHGWVISYNAADISQQTGVWNDTPDGSQGGIWMSANGIATDGIGNFYVASGNGAFNGNVSGGRNFSESALRLNATTAGITLQDWFTPDDQFSLSGRDADFGVSGPVLLPNQSGSHPHVMVTSDKTGQLYLLNRDNLNHYNGSFNADIQDWSDGGYSIHSNFAFFNNTLYLAPDGGPVQAYTFNPGTGLFTTTPSSHSNHLFGNNQSDGAGSNLTISANGTQAGIVWAIDYSNYGNGPLVLHAYDATNLTNELYNSSQAAQGRDTGPVSVKFTSPTVAKGRVYVGGRNAVAVYGLLQSAPTTVLAPTFSIAAGSYSSTQSVALSDATPGATIYYTTDGSTPTNGSTVYSSAITVSATETINAIATAPGLINSPVASASYTITPSGPPPPTTISYGSGFPSGGMRLNGSSTLVGSALRLTNGTGGQSASAYFPYALSTQAFTTQFTLQLTNPNADGITFVIQNAGLSAIGGAGYNLGYGGIGHSVAIKFDLYNNAGEGVDSTGIYVNGAVPTVPAIDLTPSGVNLHTGDLMKVLAVYNGTVLTVTITDTVTGATSTQTYTINIPGTVGGNIAYFGFTGGTGGQAAIQDIVNWTYVPTAGTTPPPNLPNYPNGFAGSSLTLNGGATLNGARLRLTDGGGGEARSAFFPTQVSVQQFSTNFTFQLTNANADGFTFTLQRVGATAVGPGGGGLGYGPNTPGGTPGIPTSLAVKFDLYNNDFEGSDSTGLYFNGASPTVPAIDLTNTGINLHSGNIFSANLSYNGTVLTVVITDTVTKASATQTYTVNIPAEIGGSSAYVGFAGGTGGLTATQDILTWTFTGQASTGPPATVATPTFSVAAGTYTSTQSVTLNDATAGATIYYTTNGSAPGTGSTVFSPSSPIVVSASETINALAAAPNLTNSAVATASYVISPPATVATPTFSPAGGTYTSTQSVTIADATKGATIYYTTNGSAPGTGSPVFSSSSPISVSANETIKAIATAPNLTNSAVGSASYVITASAPLVAILTPTNSQVLSGTVNVTAQINTTLDAAGSYVLVDGKEYGTKVVSAPPYVYPIDTTTLTNGSHTLQLWAHNTSNQVLLSAIVTVTVTNTGGGSGGGGGGTTYPIALTYPANGQTVSGTINVTATITQTLDAAASYLMVDGAEYGTQRVNPGPYIYSLNTGTLSLGLHTLQIWAHDTNNDVLLSNPVSITVTR